MCPGKLYRVRRFEMNPEENAHITIRVEGDWRLEDTSGSQVFGGKAGTYTLVFTANSATSLAMITIDPDPGGGTAE